MNEPKPTTIIGTAENGKGGALVITKEKKVYYLDKLAYWEDAVLHKEVSVTGIVFIETYKEEDLKNDKGEYSQGMCGEKMILLNAKWKLNE